MSIDLIHHELRHVWTTSDGKRFFDKFDALEHETELEHTRETEEEMKESFKLFELGEE